MCDFFGMLVPRGLLRPEAASYAFGLNSRYQIDPTHPQLEATMPGCSLARAMNHSCMPNVCSALASNPPLPPLTMQLANHASFTFSCIFLFLRAAKCVIAWQQLS